MKDLPHHMKKLNRRIVRTERRMQIDDEEYIEPIPVRPKKEAKKPAKTAVRTPKVDMEEEYAQPQKNRRESRSKRPFVRSAKHAFL